MNKTLVIIGVILIVLGIIAYVFTTTVERERLGGLFEEEKTRAPYRDAAWPLMIIGLVLVIIGSFVGSWDKRRRTIVPVQSY